MGRSKTDAVHVPVREYILRLIRSGGLSEGDPIETEESLTQRFGISRRSVRTALQDLTDQGYLRKIQGKGTFVTHSEQRMCLRNRLRPNLKILVLLEKGESPESISTYYKGFIEGIAYGAGERGHLLIYATPPVDPDTLLKIYEMEGCNGIIWLKADKIFQPVIRKLDGLGIPQVLVNRVMDGVSCVCDDEDFAFSEIACFLASMGHKRIVFLNADFGEPIYVHRGDCFARHMKASGLTGIHIQETPEKWISSLESAFTGLERPTALILGGHTIFDRCLPWLSSKRIPGDFSVICYNDSPDAISFKTPLTVYSDPRQEIGRKALNSLELSMYDKSAKGGRQFVHGNLIARRSCAIPPFLSAKALK